MPIRDRKQALQLMESTDPLILAAKIEEYITVTHQPDQSAHIAIPQDTPHYLAISLQPDGTIHTKGLMVIPGNIILPNPELAGSESPEGCLGIQTAIRAAVVTEATKLIAETHGLPTNYHDTWLIAAALRKWTRTLPRDTAARIRGSNRHAQMENAVRQLLDQTAWEVARNNKGKVNPKRYNRVVAAGATAIAQLSGTNPGATSWLLSQERATSQTLQHPGEIIKQVHERARKAGVDQRYWKTIARMDPEVMELLMQRHVPQYAVGIIINACGDIQCSPTTTQVSNALWLFSTCKRRSDYIGPTRREENPIATRARERLRHLMRLIFKATGTEQPVEADWQTISYLADYAVYIIDNDRDITAQTFGGFQKAAQRWHQAEQLEIAAAEIQAEIDRQEGWFHSWNSLVEATTVPDPTDPTMPVISVVPLTNTHALLQEGREMRHCVGTYSNQCLDGRSRIFSIRQDGHTLATTQLSLTMGQWKVSQTKAVKNGSPPQNAQLTARFLSQKYQEIWKGLGDAPHKHRCWLQHPITGKTKPSPKTKRR